MPTGSSRGPRGLAALLTGLQALALVGFAAFYVYELAIGKGSDATRVLMSALLILVGAIALALVGRGWLAGASWPRTPTIVWNALLLPVAVGLVRGTQLLAGWTLLVVALVGILAALAVRDPDDLGPGAETGG